MTRTRDIRGRRGFSFVEIVLSLSVVGVIVTAVAGVYVSGLQAEEAARTRTPTESYLRSAMEKALATHFDNLSTVSAGITIGGQTETLTRRVSNVDLNRDGSTDPDAKLVTVILLGDSLSTIIVNTNDEIEKIP